MDAKFHPAIAAIKSGDVDRLRALVSEDPTLATSRSSTSHPTLLQCLVLSGRDVPNKIETAQVLINAGADLNGPLGACGSCNNVETAALLLDCGAYLRCFEIKGLTVANSSASDGCGLDIPSWSIPQSRRAPTLAGVLVVKKLPGTALW